MDENKSGLWIVAIVAVVAVVSLIILGTESRTNGIVRIQEPSVQTITNSEDIAGLAMYKAARQIKIDNGELIDNIVSICQFEKNTPWVNPCESVKACEGLVVNCKNRGGVHNFVDMP